MFKSFRDRRSRFCELVISPTKKCRDLNIKNHQNHGFKGFVEGNILPGKPWFLHVFTMKCRGFLQIASSKHTLLLQTPSETEFGVFWGLNTFSEAIWSTRDIHKYSEMVISPTCGDWIQHKFWVTLAFNSIMPVICWWLSHPVVDFTLIWY